MSTATIFFADTLQAALYEHELVGQISDGCWENSRPYDHWKRPCAAKVAVDSENPRVESTHLFKRGYNFNNSMLVEVVGERMKNIIMLSKAGYSKEIISKFEEIYDCMFTERNEYWNKLRAVFIETFGTKAEYDRIVNTDRISTPALRKMLREMSVIVSSGSRSK